MSGVVDAVGKVFKAVFNVAKVVVPIALGAAAIVFTGGAALGVAGPLGAGFGSAISGLAGTLGLTGTLGAAFTGALTYAGYGAVAGGLTSLVTGGKFLKGVEQGALYGDIAGGVGGALGLVSPAAPSWGPGATASDAAQGAAQLGLNGPVQVTGQTVGSPAAMAAANAPTAVGAPSATAAPTPAPSGNPAVPTTGTGGNWWDSGNSGLMGNLLSGIGKGLYGDPAVEYAKSRDAQLQANYAVGTNSGMLTPQSTSYLETLPNLRPPSTAFSSIPAQGGTYGYHYEFDSQSGQIKKVANTPVTYPGASGG